jgi:pimeloyl-ACP methyl ester carboxylesterase
VATFARVCTYDRAGYGWSDPGPGPRAAGRAGEEHHPLLGGAGVPAPYVLAAHSYGGHIARVFAGSYPDEVAGLVLVDPTNEEGQLAVPEAERQRQAARVREDARRDALLAQLGFVRLYLALGLWNEPDWLHRLPPETRAPYLALGQLPKRIEADAEESAAGAAGAAQARDARLPESLPLIILTADRGLDPADPSMAARLRLHAEKARLSTRGEHRVIAGSGHFIMVDQPGAVSAAIRDVLAASSPKAAGA